MRRGDVFQVDFGSVDGHTVALRRPALILSDRPTAGRSQTVVVLPITTGLGQASLFAHSHVVQPSKVNGLTEPSLVLIEMIQVVDLTDVLNKRGQLEDAPFREVIRKLNEFLIRP